MQVPLLLSANPRWQDETRQPPAMHSTTSTPGKAVQSWPWTSPRSGNWQPPQDSMSDEVSMHSKTSARLGEVETAQARCPVGQRFGNERRWLTAAPEPHELVWEPEPRI